MHKKRCLQFSGSLKTNIFYCVFTSYNLSAGYSRDWSNSRQEFKLHLTPISPSELFFHQDKSSCGLMALTGQHMGVLRPLFPPSYKLGNTTGQQCPKFK